MHTEIPGASSKCPGDFTLGVAEAGSHEPCILILGEYSIKDIFKSIA
jgi:hypothetical protein